MECLWLTMEAVWASSPQTLPKKQKVSCFLVSYMPLAVKRGARQPSVRAVDPPALPSTLLQLRRPLLRPGTEPFTTRRLDRPNTAQGPLLLFCRARGCVRLAENRFARPRCACAALRT